jgi:hypothetical protein
VEDVMARYVWAVDSLDAEGDVAVFTEDAVIDSNGSMSRGRDETVPTDGCTVEAEPDSAELHFGSGVERLRNPQM